ncbi:hypothetical protein BH11PLA2_BH11PLA2_49340 [soil metagenome]
MFSLALKFIWSSLEVPSREAVRATLADLAWVGLTFILFVSTIDLPNHIAAENPDDGWQALLPHLARHGVRFGVDTCYCYGPLYYLIISPYDAASFDQKYILELTSKLIAGLMLLRLARQLAPAAGIALLIGSSLIMLAVPLEQEYMMLAGLGGLLVPLLRRRVTPFDFTITPAFLAAVGLAKFTPFVFALCGLVIFSAYLLTIRPRVLATLPLAMFGLATLAFWSLTGQRLADLPAFVASSFHYSQAYNEGLALPGPVSETRIALGILSLLCLKLYLCRECLWRDRRAATIAGVLLLMMLTGLRWKVGFVRHDSHSLLTFVMLLVVPALLHHLLGGRRHITIAATLLAGIGVYAVLDHNHLNSVYQQSPVAAWKQHWSNLTQPLDLQAKLERERRGEQARLDLPLIRAIVGTAGIDCVTECQGVALLNGLNVTPRPTLQSVNAMDAAMLNENAAYFAGPSAPPFVLLNWTSFDLRYPTMTEGPSLLTLLGHYEVAMEQKGYLLLKRRVTPRTSDAVTILDRTAAIDEVIELPPPTTGERRTISLDVTKTASGSLHTTAFRPPVLFFVVRTEDGEWHSFRLVAPMATAEFLLDPLCETNAELRTLFESDSGRRVTAIRLHVMKSERGLVHATYSLRIRSIHGS